MFPVLASNSPSGYNLTKSLRFRSAASAYLNRTPSSSGNQQIHTFSAWIKYSTGTADGNLISFGNSTTYQIWIGNSGANLYCGTQVLGVSNPWYVGLNNVFRDPSSWYHIVIAIDTTQATAANRVKIYVNGVQQTSYQSANYPSQNYNTGANSTTSHSICRRDDNVQFYNGYLAEVNWIDGQQLTPSSFGSTNALTGVWQPAKYTGTYGTNGFYLPFTNNASTTTIGYDFSGNGNNWTSNNISLTAGTTYDSMTDVPTLTNATTANYAVINPLIYRYSAGNSTFSNGNLTITGSNTGSSYFQLASVAIPSSSSKFYWENTLGTTSSGTYLGITQFSNFQSGNWDVWYDTVNGVVYKGASSFASVATAASGDIVGIAYDSTANTCAIYKNNALLTTVTGITAAEQVPLMCTRQASVINLNFGQQPFAYTPPTGFVALNTYNLSTSTIVKGNTVMDATTYTGNGSSQTIANSGGFQPDLVWVKDRTSAYNHILASTPCNITHFLQSNTTDAESVSTGRVDAVTSTGFTVGSAANTNQSSDAYVAWQWQAGQGTTSSNTSGSIASTVSVNATAGFSVVTYTGTGSAATVGHGLGVAPSMIIAKSRNGASHWPVYHSASGPTLSVFLNLTDGNGGYPSTWNNTAPTSSVFSIGTYLGSTTQVAYCWAEIAGFSKFGSYTGNGSTDGTFVYTGFRPKFVMVKRTDAANSWGMIDTSRSPENTATRYLQAESSSAENSDNQFDIVSNGFKCRLSGALTNASGGTYIYMAFAENPFKNALAR